MLPKPIAHWILGHVSRETLEWIVGIFLLIPMAIGPVVVAAVLFVSLRKAKPAPGTGIGFTRIGNMILASLFFLGMIWPDDWRLLSAPPPASFEPSPFYHTMVAWVICVWFLSAALLFFRNRLAWLGSLLGVGSAVFGFSWILFGVIKQSLFPDEADAAHLAQIHLVARISAAAIFLIFSGACLLFSGGVFIGLVKSRKELGWI